MSEFTIIYHITKEKILISVFKSCRFIIEAITGLKGNMPLSMEENEIERNT